ncbi:MAG: glutamate 5-kinase [Alphaproteobacteria bacterium]
MASRARRIVVKIGSALLVDDQGRGAPLIRRTWLEALADDVAALHADGADVLIVSSGAIAVGRGPLGLARSQVRRALTLEEKQASAATGQIRLAHAYQDALARHSIVVAQLLLTFDDTERRRRHLNARGTVAALLKRRVVPVINENDTVATEEIRFGDNDRLAARVAQMASADTLILLSDIDGLYERDPNADPLAPFVPEVGEITPRIEAMAGAARPGYSSGGMVTKLAAAKIAMAAGCRMAIADGRADHALARVMAGSRCTWFVPSQTPLTARKQWIAGSLKPVGTLVVDAGAAQALRAGRSLLPAGVVAVEGRFERGDPVVVREGGGAEIARGLVAYDADDARRIIGHRSADIEEVLGFRGRAELVHRDDLVVTASAAPAVRVGA